MKDYEKLDELIEQVCEEEGVEVDDIFDMPQENNSSMIGQFEEKFEVKLPEDFKYFLSKYGSGGLGYFNFFGVESGKDDANNTSLGFINNEYREKGMPNHLVVIEHNGDYVTCIDTSKSEGEIVSWSWLDNDGIVKYSNTFEMYFIEKLEDCL